MCGEANMVMFRLVLQEQAGNIRTLVMYWEPDRLVTTPAIEAKRISLYEYHQVVRNILAWIPDGF